ncbi:hypothetical protein R6L23_02325 [Streptomyces sp. SR27]|uniref:hypothetical protein n=1 Tax=Streptomyces sp. SR27 TaxID=3076630 RepID=UPI00295C1B6C|nr:hypothetical protein [Streptomyces sp. SR27]MDV9187063.1 hypothetical protein [Streptomyces sp. SR27]
MDDEESLRRYGLRPIGVDLDEIRSLLREHAERERRAQGEGDTELMKLCCVQLFNSGDIDDALLVWSAKEASFDTGCSIDIELLLGHGLDATKAHLSAHPEPSAAAALDRLRELEVDGEFEGFSVEKRSAFYDRYYDGY